MLKIAYYISQIFMIFLGSNQRGILNTGVKSHVKFVYLKGQGKEENWIHVSKQRRNLSILNSDFQEKFVYMPKEEENFVYSLHRLVVMNNVI